ncbi:MAG: hypothetical protein HN855_13015 [Anaerolineae bacterium]|jgi:predicted anti-sigma-YlaC factor YlaD|nr:hypothetical protein [Anaerolineae bacterium]MBT7073216.1 hypothetical protein [Anaerolineae bacterium]MBT7326075.1 hypothetical protein [Anaerolineae bacterium]
MPDHKFELLNAYLDGELNPQQHRKTEAHLETCEECRAELETLETLSGTLAEVPLPEFSPPEQLVANVALQLPRKPLKEPASRKWLEYGWWLAPIGLIATWAFISIYTVAGDLVGAASNLGLVENASIFAGNSTNYSALLGRFGLLDPSMLEWLVPSETFIRQFFSQLIWQVALAMLYLSWIAIWWVRQTRLGPKQQFGN